MEGLGELDKSPVEAFSDLPFPNPSIDQLSTLSLCKPILIHHTSACRHALPESPTAGAHQGTTPLEDCSSEDLTDWHHPFTPHLPTRQSSSRIAICSLLSLSQSALPSTRMHARPGDQAMHLPLPDWVPHKIHPPSRIRACLIHPVPSSALKQSSCPHSAGPYRFSHPRERHALLQGCASRAQRGLRGRLSGDVW